MGTALVVFYMATNVPGKHYMSENTNRIEKAVAALGKAFQEKGQPRLFAGADGFVDEIIHVVDKRHDAHHFEPIATISAYAARLAEAAGKSTNVEFVVQQVKSGGNGPLMSEAFGRLGGYVRYAGSIGWPEVDPLFKHLESYGDLITIAPAAVTLATEFEDGKIMHGKHESLKEVTWPNFLERLGGEERLDFALREADVVSLVNWTMLPFLNDVIRGVLSRVQTLGEEAPKAFFFDLCDPEKRTREDLLEALAVMTAFTQYASIVILGLNEKESLAVCEALDIEPGPEDREALVDRARRLAREIGFSEIVIHPTRCASVWSKGANGSIDGPFCAKPILTTGAGDHFNGAYVFARVLGLSPGDAIIIGKCASGFYVRQGRGPSVEEVGIFAQRWAAGKLDPWESMPS